jgi:hypothetical protein
VAQAEGLFGYGSGFNHGGVVGTSLDADGTTISYGTAEALRGAAEGDAALRALLEKMASERRSEAVYGTGGIGRGVEIDSMDGETSAGNAYGQMNATQLRAFYSKTYGLIAGEWDYILPYRGIGWGSDAAGRLTGGLPQTATGLLGQGLGTTTGTTWGGTGSKDPLEHSVQRVRMGPWGAWKWNCIGR